MKIGSGHTLILNGVSKSYSDGDKQVEVLRELSISIDAGQSIAVTGPSGSGKSTILNLLAGLLTPDAGSIQLSIGQRTINLDSATERERTAVRRQHIGYVYQFFNLVPTLTVFENVCLPARLNKRRELGDHAAGLLKRFGLENRFYTYPEVLSGGEQQRVAVARALVMSPPLLLADEPTGNLDAANTEQVTDLLFETAYELGVTLVIATHNIEVAARADLQLKLGATD